MTLGGSEVLQEALSMLLVAPVGGLSSYGHSGFPAKTPSQSSVVDEWLTARRVARLWRQLFGLPAPADAHNHVQGGADRWK